MQAGALLSRACDLGNGTACAELAHAFATGTPRQPKDPARAATLADRGCARGSGEACKVSALELWKRRDASEDDVHRAVACFEKRSRGDARRVRSPVAALAP